MRHMAEITVKQLAQVVERSVDTLIAQMQEAGLARREPDDLVTDSEKQQLLAYLKRSHGDRAVDNQQISLKRKTVSTIKTTPATGGKAKTVSVEVRKTRTFVKPAGEDLNQEIQARKVAEEEAARKVAEEAAARKAAEEEAARKVAEEAARKAAEDAARKAAEEAARKAAEEIGVLIVVFVLLFRVICLSSEVSP